MSENRYNLCWKATHPCYMWWLYYNGEEVCNGNAISIRRVKVKAKRAIKVHNELTSVLY